VSQRNRRLSVVQEIELIAAFERGELDLPEVVLMTHLLLERGWVWNMPAPYQALARGWIDVGILTDPRKVTMDRPKIKIIVKEGKPVQIVSEKGEIDVVLEEEGVATSTFTAAPNRPVEEND
jgi:hypothetical protein